MFNSDDLTPSNSSILSTASQTDGRTKAGMDGQRLDWMDKGKDREKLGWMDISRVEWSGGCKKGARPIRLTMRPHV